MNLPALISVVIPTIGRPSLVIAAVSSALRQTLHEIEVIVVVDGPDEATLNALSSIDDARLRVLPMRENVGLAGARHAGIDAAHGRWIALLDDDDQWLPQKLETQLDAAARSVHRLPIITCRVIARSDHGDAIRPRRTPAQGEPLCEYLFCKTALFGGEGLILPSTLLVPRVLFADAGLRFRSVPFEGSDWLLRATQREDVGVEFVATRAPLAIWHCADSRARISTRRNWRTSLAWANAADSLLTPRAHASFVLNRVSAEARRQGEISALWLLPCASFRRGHPTPISLLAHALNWIVPTGLRSMLVAFRNRRSLVPDAEIVPVTLRPGS